MSKSLLDTLMAKAEATTAPAPKETEITIDRKVIVQLVKTPRGELFSATQLWKLMGSPKSLRPVEYLRLEATKRFIQSEYPKEDVSVENNELSVKKCRSSLLNKDSIYKTYRGRNAGTYMEKKLLLDYAQWLSPAIKSMVLETFIEYGQIAMEKDPDKKAKMLIEKGFDTIVDLKVDGQTPKETEDEKFESLKRALAIASRKKFTAELEVITGKRMVDSPELRSYVAYITDRLYVHVLGDTTKGLRKGLGLGTHSTPREAMNETYITVIHFVETAIVRYLRQHKEKSTKRGIEDVIIKIANMQKPMLEYADEWEPVAVHTRKRKGSGHTKGVYSANRSGVRGLSYEYDANLKKIEGA